MRIVVCVKQVPGSSAVEVDPVTGVLRRDGVAAKLNPYDLFALETAFLLAEQTGGEVAVLTMGPMAAKDALLESIWMGAREATLLTDRKFAGADVAATSYSLMLGIKTMGPFDLILSGKQTTDGDTAQVGPELAERLGIEHAANVLSIDEVEDKSVTVTIDLDGVLQRQRMALPCLLAMDKDVNTPRLPSYLRRKATDPKQQIRVLTAADLVGADESRLGLEGSPTQVERIFPPEKNADKRMITGSADQLADVLYTLFLEKKFL